MGALAAAKRKAHVVADVVAHAPTNSGADAQTLVGTVALANAVSNVASVAGTDGAADVGTLAAANITTKPKTNVVADLVANAPTNFAAKPMANAPSLARSDAATDTKTVVFFAKSAADAGALAPALARAVVGAVA